MTSSKLPFARQLFSSLLIVMLLLCSQTDSSAQTEKKGQPIKIGFIASLSGPATENCRTLLKGFRLYLDQNHNQIAGRPVEVIAEDDAASPDTAKQKFEKLAQQDHADIICGLYFSHVAYAVAPLAAKYQVPLVIAVASADDLTQRKSSDWIVRASHSSSQASHPFGEWVYKHLGYKKVATIALDYPFGYESVGGFQSTFEKAGGQVIQKIWAPIDVHDLSPYLRKISKDADAVYTVFVGRAAQIAGAQWQQFAPHIRVTGNGDSFDETVIAAYGDVFDGAYSALPYCSTLQTAANSAFVAAYRNAYGRAPTSFAERGYTAAMLIQKAIERMGGNVDDKAKLMAALRKQPLPDAPRGPMTFDAFGNPVQNIYIRRVAKQEGSFENVIVDQIPRVSQFWTSSPSEYMKRPLYSRDYPPCKYCLPSP